MHQFSLYISGLLADLIYKQSGPTVIVVEKEIKSEIKLDPRGLVRTDIKFLKDRVPAPYWKEGTTIQEIAYAQGQQDLISFIETRLIGRRVDG
jgi:hypothetical protein